MKKELILALLILAGVAFTVCGICGCEEAQQKPFGPPKDLRWREKYGTNDIANISYNILKLDHFVALNSRALFPKYKDPNDPQKIITIDRVAELEKRLKKLEEQTVKDGDKITTK